MSQLDNDRFIGFDANNAPQPQEDADGGMRGGNPRDELHELLVTTTSLSEAEIQEAIRLAGNISQTLSRRITNDAGETIDKTIRDKVSEDLADETTGGAGSSAGNALGAAGVTAGTIGSAFGNQALGIIGSSIGASSVKGQQWATRILQGSAIAANAAGAVRNFPNTPIGRIFNQGGQVGKWNQFWILVGERIEREIRFSLPRAGATWNKGLGPRGMRYGPQLGRTEFSDAGAEIESIVNSYLNNTSQGAHVPKPHGQTTSPAFQQQGGSERDGLKETGKDLDAHWGAPPRSGHTIKAMYGDGSGLENTDEVRDAEEFLRQKEEKYEEWDRLYNPGDAGQRLSGKFNENIVKVEDTDSHGITAGGDSTGRTSADLYHRKRTLDFYDDSRDASRAGETENDGDENISRFSSPGQKTISGNARDFLEWAGYRLRWGEAYTHLFNVYIYDSLGYGPLGDDDSTLDFTAENDGYEKAFSFGVTGVSLSNFSITNNRPGVLKTPLPQSADIPESLTLHLKDYARMPLYQYMYSWYLHWYNPHKRRWVPGKQGKYKNIKIEVQHLYGQYTDEDGNIRDAAGEDPANTGADSSGINFGYKTFLTITALNCIPRGVPGLNLEYGASVSPFEFDMELEPSDVYFDFDNTNFYVDSMMKPHLEEVYHRANDQAHQQVGSMGTEASRAWEE